MNFGRSCYLGLIISVSSTAAWGQAYVAVFSMKFRIPMSDATPNLTNKIKAAFLGQVSEIAN